MESILKQMDVMLIDDLVPPIKELTEKCLNEGKKKKCQLDFYFYQKKY